MTRVLRELNILFAKKMLDYSGMLRVDYTNNLNLVWGACEKAGYTCNVSTEYMGKEIMYYATALNKAGEARGAYGRTPAEALMRTALFRVGKDERVGK